MRRTTNCSYQWSSYIRISGITVRSTSNNSQGSRWKVVQTWCYQYCKGTNHRKRSWWEKMIQVSRKTNIILVKWNDLHGLDQHYKTQVLLFIRKEQRCADCKSLQLTQVSLLFSFHSLISYSSHPCIQLKTSTNLPRTPVLELGNQGNSCWAAACCQLLYCAHMHSGQALFSFRHCRQPPPCVEVTPNFSPFAPFLLQQPWAYLLLFCRISTRWWTTATLSIRGGRFIQISFPFLALTWRSTSSRIQGYFLVSPLLIPSFSVNFHCSCFTKLLSSTCCPLWVTTRRDNSCAWK